ncbi:unnamed protein product [Hermetia illucens]|uniref:Cytochrome P450 n=1 Tax=Hermetia illucens TaxID=343691 RepID=A0A7R8UEX7_HERIL|nr:unnamed protein product [Hermetia illucens]
MRTFIPVYSIHHDPDIYPNPEIFDPNRFTSEEKRKRHPMSFLGFGDGPRNCIGLRFGQMQTRVGLVTLLRKYRFKFCSKTLNPMKFSIDNPILGPDGGLWLKIENI